MLDPDDGGERFGHAIDGKLDEDRLVHRNQQAHQLRRDAVPEHDAPEHAELGVVRRRGGVGGVARQRVRRAARHAIERLDQVEE